LNLGELISSNRSHIEEVLVIGRASWSDLLDKVHRTYASSNPDQYDEQLWTFLVACGYAISGEIGARTINELFGIDWIDDHRIWFEVLPLPPRPFEGNTNLDLALGAITQRGSTQSGISYSQKDGTSICFIESKWYSDISTGTSHDLHRNQLARVIDSAIAFKSDQGEFPKAVHVGLLTPGIFKVRRAPSRFYRYKWNEYSDRAALVRDLEDHPSALEIDHDYPKLLQRLELYWVTFEQLILHIPDRKFRDALIDFAKNHSKALDFQLSAA
jgi:hypothetical protein